MHTASLASPAQVPGTQTLDRSFALLRAIAAAAAVDAIHLADTGHRRFRIIESRPAA